VATLLNTKVFLPIEDEFDLFLMVLIQLTSGWQVQKLKNEIGIPVNPAVLEVLHALLLFSFCWCADFIFRLYKGYSYPNI